MTTAKQIRAAEVNAIIIAVCRHYKADPEKTLIGTGAQPANVKYARCVICYHLHRCGMSLRSLGRLFRRSEDSAGKWNKAGLVLMMKPKIEAMVGGLPRLTPTLEISDC